MRKKARIFLSFLFSLIILTSILNIPTMAAPAKSNFQIDFIDVGQGDASLVQCDGHYMLVDGGNPKKSALIYSYLKYRNITYLDYIVGTHADADHIGGLAGALNYAYVGRAYCSTTYHDTRAFKSFIKYLNYQGIPISVPSCGDQFSLGSATVTVVGPVRSASDSNNNSIVLRIEYGNTSFLLTGDAEEAEEKDIINNTQNLQSTVLKVGHHGSSNSTSYLFLRTVDPQYAVISVGSDNTYGHPTEKTLSRLRDADVRTYRTDMQGTIICTSDGKDVLFQTARNQDTDTLAGAGLGQKNASKTYPKQNQTIIVSPAVSPQEDLSSSAGTYILNTNTKKFHYPDCSSVKDMKEKNKRVFNGTRDEVIAQGYVPCKRCNP